MEGLHLVMAITDREKSDKVVSLFDDNNVATTYALMGEGTAPPEVLDYLYLSQSEKIIVVGVVTNTGIAPLIKSAKRKLYIDYPGNGIMASIPLNSVGGKRCLQYIMDGQAIDLNEKKSDEVEREERMAIKTDYEMIFFIANEGYSDMIMDAARGAGAKGGTVIKGRGTGAESHGHCHRRYRQVYCTHVQNTYDL